METETKALYEKSVHQIDYLLIEGTGQISRIVTHRK